jgi:adenine-specific DNA-methyltransferase
MATKDYSLLTREDLVSLLLKYDEKKKYGIVWDEERVPEKVVTDCQTHLPVLTEVKDKEIITNPNELTHLLIEGDNYHTLSVLNYTHQGKIDLIYIDPPYNTGNKDFIYNDKYVENEDDYKHSKWLNFMSKRLELARELLTENGVIFISIDNNEHAQLKLLCDKIFGENNFVENYLWNKTSTPPALSKKSRKTHEYILCYQNKIDSKMFIGLVSEGGDAPLLNEGNKKITLNFPCNIVKSTLKDGIYTKGIKDRVVLENDVEIKNGLIVNQFSLTGNFRWVQETLNKEIKNNCCLIVKSDKFSIRYSRLGQRTVAPPNYITDRFYNSKIDKSEEEVGTNEAAGNELFEILGKKIFSFPKPVSLIKYLISFIENKNIVVLDFFAGSGTTAQAVLELNKKDGGNRQFIITTNNESEICNNVTYPRVSKIIQGYENTKKTEINGLGGNLKYFKTSFVENVSNRDQVRLQVTRRCTEMLCVKEGIYNLKKETLDWKIFEQNNNFLGVYYEMSQIALDELKEEMNELNGNKVLYCFTVEREVNQNDFEDWDNTRIETIPQKILEVYRRIFTKE